MFAFRHVQRALRDDRWKLIPYPEINRTPLFDLQNDPHEITNLADQPEHAGRVRTLSASLLTAMKAAGDSGTALTVERPAPAAFDPQAPPPAIGKAKQQQQKA